MIGTKAYFQGSSLDLKVSGREFKLEFLDFAELTCNFVQGIRSAQIVPILAGVLITAAGLGILKFYHYKIARTPYPTNPALRISSLRAGNAGLRLYTCMIRDTVSARRGVWVSMVLR